MAIIEEILRSEAKPKEKQARLVAAVCGKSVSAKTFIDFFVTASDTDKGTCADVMKHVSAQKPDILAPFMNILIKYVGYKAARVKWGVSQAIGNMSKDYPDKAAKSVAVLLKNTVYNRTNTTVIRWCAAYALSEIAINSAGARKQLLPIFEKIVKNEKNNGVRNVYVKAQKAIR